MENATTLDLQSRPQKTGICFLLQALSRANTRTKCLHGRRACQVFLDGCLPKEKYSMFRHKSVSSAGFPRLKEPEEGFDNRERPPTGCVGKVPSWGGWHSLTGPCCRASLGGEASILAQVVQLT